ncbi:hypothetical protein PCASD_07085 [Puccinia coronata f. sp. avenae]|uniref:Uncharacterized protein n=1 Tax=Puccinia coronata f. sp. avenae TaxID=200324 RepID=A0A2N5V6R1_9BASI|nr:hypothetical protein PCASD_07085 [Puccinia coronata f. sp. avenae]
MHLDGLSIEVGQARTGHRGKVPIRRLGSGFRPSAAEPGGYPALVRVLPDFQAPRFSAEGLKASVEANLNAKNSLQMVSEALLDPLQLSGWIPDFQKAVPHPDPIRGLVGCCEFCGVRIGTLHR